MTGRVWRQLFDEATARLGSKVDARRIVEAAAADDWPQCLDAAVPDRARSFFDAMVARRAAGEPLQYVVGRWDFRSLELLVDRRVRTDVGVPSQPTMTRHPPA